MLHPARRLLQCGHSQLQGCMALGKYNPGRAAEAISGRPLFDDRCLYHHINCHIYRIRVASLQKLCLFSSGRRFITAKPPVIPPHRSGLSFNAFLSERLLADKVMPVIGPPYDKLEQLLLE
ncbi:uncharacterized protein EpC_27480 [Erwinia pyrifoliae Ep1/96]|nr:uncharacterized protein EpC_27480 [Erwinia pyrifoliae Ep1/96]